jgi:hypothetical protein
LGAHSLQDIAEESVNMLDADITFENEKRRIREFINLQQGKLNRQQMMKRRTIQRSKTVRSAMYKFWKAIEAHTIAGAYVPKELYVKFNYKLYHALFGAGDEDSELNTAAGAMHELPAA